MQSLRLFFSSARQQSWLVPALLLLLQLLSRGHHVPTSLAILPSAAWAVFLLAGRYAPSATLFGLLLGEAALIDYLAITRYGVSDFCVSPAYAALLPAYAVLWLAGRWLHRRPVSAPLATSAGQTIVATVLGTLLCELISSGSFYVYSGRFAEPTLAAFAERLFRYYPANLLSALLWMGLINLLVQAVRSLRLQRA